MSEPQWILEQAALAAHQRHLTEHGGKAGVDRSRLTEALKTPSLLWQANGALGVMILAVAYAEAILKYRPFVSGNIAAAYLLFVLFLKLNKVPLLAPKVEKYIMMRALSMGRINGHAFAQWLRLRNQNDDASPKTLIHVHLHDKKVKQVTIVRTKPSAQPVETG